MDRAATQFAISALMGQVRARIGDAAGTIKAAGACFEAGNTDKSVEIASIWSSNSMRRVVYWMPQA